MSRHFAWGIAFTAALVMLTGCQSSQDKYNVTSSYSTPKSVALVESVPGQRDKTIWSMDIPVHHRLDTRIVREAHGSAAKEMFVDVKGTPKEMHWMLYNLEGQDGDTEQVDEGMLKLTGKPVKWDLTIREPGQQPRAQLGGPEPTPDEEGEVAPAEPEAEEAEPEDNAGNDEMEADDNADMDSNADDANADGMESSNNG